MEVLEHKERERVSESERKIVNDRIWELGLEVRGKSEIYKRNLEVLEHKERELESEWESELRVRKKEKTRVVKMRQFLTLTALT